MGVSDRLLNIKKLGKQLGAPVITYITGDSALWHYGIEDDDIVPFHRVLRVVAKGDKLTELYLFLFTSELDPRIARRLVGQINEYVEAYHVIIPYKCHGFGTHVALGARSIMMTPLAELGEAFPPCAIPGPEGFVPGDPALIRQYFPDEETIARQTRTAPYAAKDQLIGPWAIALTKAEIDRISKLVGELLGRGGYAPEAHKKIIESLSSGRPRISRDIAKDIGLNVIVPDPDLEQMIMSLYDSYAQELDLGSSIRVTNGKRGKPTDLDVLPLALSKNNMPPNWNILETEQRPKMGYIECEEEGYVKIGLYRQSHERARRIIGKWMNAMDVEKEKFIEESLLWKSRLKHKMGVK